jgi:hypothetical protein
VTNADSPLILVPGVAVAAGSDLYLAGGTGVGTAFVNGYDFIPGGSLARRVGLGCRRTERRAGELLSASEKDGEAAVTIGTCRPLVILELARRSSGLRHRGRLCGYTGGYVSFRNQQTRNDPLLRQQAAQAQTRTEILHAADTGASGPPTEPPTPTTSTPVTTTAPLPLPPPPPPTTTPPSANCDGLTGQLFNRRLQAFFQSHGLTE